MRAEVAREWWFRAWAERDSTARFSRLHQAMKAEGAPAILSDLCAESAEDERRHAALCADLAATIDETDPYAAQPHPGEPLGPSSLSVPERLLYELVAFCCVTESLNSALLLTIYEAAAHERIKATAHELLKDEVKHARLGWAYLAHYAANVGEPTFLSARVPRMLDAAKSENLTESDAFCATWSDPALGYLSRQTRLDVFDESVATVIAPGLQKYAITTHLRAKP